VPNKSEELPKRKKPTPEQEKSIMIQNIITTSTILGLIFGAGLVFYMALNPQIEEKQPAKGNMQGQNFGEIQKT